MDDYQKALLDEIVGEVDKILAKCRPDRADVADAYQRLLALVNVLKGQPSKPVSTKDFQ